MEEDKKGEGGEEKRGEMTIRGTEKEEGRGGRISKEVTKQKMKKRKESTKGKKECENKNKDEAKSEEDGREEGEPR